MNRFCWAVTVWAVVVVSAVPRMARAEECRVVEVEMVPTHDLQIVVWFEDGAGNFIDTAFITRKTGSFGIGNRPGMLEFNSGPEWPYGRRESTFPVWAHRHGQEWPLLVFQNHDDSDPVNYSPDNGTVSPEENLSHPLTQSSLDAVFCRPIREDEPQWDAVSCATSPGVFTDKGRFHPTRTSKYPPRVDLTKVDSDSDDVSMFKQLNTLDAVSRATPVGGAPALVSWGIPSELPNGDYVVWIEVSKERDANGSYNDVPYTSVDLIWGEYGLPTLGQPSLVYRIPFSISEGTSQFTAADYHGYGAVDGADGSLRSPDGTISTGDPGSGAQRLSLVADVGGEYRVRVTARNEDDIVAPGGVVDLELIEVNSSSAVVAFKETGDDGAEGSVRGYELRISAGQPITEDNIDTATVVGIVVEPNSAGTPVSVELPGLLPSTNYFLAIRGHDECLNFGPLEVLQITTPAPPAGEVDACFVATATYGSLMATDVVTLRAFRDQVLRSSVAGELGIATYYTFAPALARLIAPSQDLRALSRLLLEPIVTAVRTLSSI